MGTRSDEHETISKFRSWLITYYKNDNYIQHIPGLSYTPGQQPPQQQVQPRQPQQMQQQPPYNPQLQPTYPVQQQPTQPVQIQQQPYQQYPANPTTYNPSKYPRDAGSVSGISAQRFTT